ncbi:hypothetical protein HY251_17015, partial [bacterium]|nr:hypothetical protein [bacterium]
MGRRLAGLGGARPGLPERPGFDYLPGVNFLAHAWVLPGSGPELVLGCALPDLLGAFDRRAPRLAGEAARALEEAGAREVARGVRAHHVADACFHDLPAFRDGCLALRGIAARLVARGERVRGFFLSHLLLEVLLDATLLEREPALVGRFYEELGRADVAGAARKASSAAGTPRDARAFASYFQGFVEARFLEGYGTDEGAALRVARVLARARQPLSPSGEALLRDEIAPARAVVRE